MSVRNWLTHGSTAGASVYLICESDRRVLYESKYAQIYKWHVYWHWPHSMWSRVYETVERPSHWSTAAARLVCCWAPHGQDRSIDSRPHRVYDAATDPLMHWGSQSLWTPSASSCRLFQHDLLKFMAPMFATQPKMRKTTSPLARQLIPLVDGKWSLINTCHHTWAPQRWSFWLIIRCYTNVMLAYLLTLSKWQGIGR